MDSAGTTRRWGWEHVFLLALLLLASARAGWQPGSLGRLAAALRGWGLAGELAALTERPATDPPRVGVLAAGLGALRPGDGRWERAVAALQLAAYQRAKRPREALAVADDLLRRQVLPGRDAWLALEAGRALLQAKRAPEAFNVAYTAAMGSPWSAGVQASLRRLMAGCLDQMGQTKGAEVIYRGLLSASPDDADALNELAYHLALAGAHLGEAEQLARRALALQQASALRVALGRRSYRAARAAYLDTLGWVLHKADRHDEAEQALRQAVRLAEPEPQAEILAHLARVLYDAGDESEAADLARRALQQDPELGEARQLLDRIHGPRPEGQVG